MTRLILTYGLISGLVVIAGIIGTMQMSGGHSLWLGYLIMLVALSSILVGVKQHRDQALGGVIGFGPALLVGLGIAVVAGLAYVAVWEVYMAATHYTFMDQYTAQILAAKRAAGVTGAAYAKVGAEMETMRRQYANPLYRMGMTFMEIFPVGLLIALASAALLRNPRFLPARSRPLAA
jgi:polyferredoxin